MKTNKFFLIVVVVFAAALSACNGNYLTDSVKGSGDLITQEFDVSDFDRISMEGFGEVNIGQGDEESLFVTTDDNLMEYVAVTVRGNTLVLTLSDTPKNHGISPTDGIVFDLIVKDLSRIDIGGAGDFSINDMVTDSLKIHIDGAGNLTLENLKADELVIEFNGVGSVFADGVVQGQQISLNGAGSYHASDLESETAVIEISGIGDATVWVTDTLDVEINSIGNVIYYGNPRVVENINSLGNLISRGSK